MASGSTLSTCGPWEFGKRALAIFREFAKLRYRLVPYLLHCACQAQRDGLPILRPLVLEFQDDPATATIDDQYLLGESLLVAPIFSESEAPVARDVYLPRGDWYDWWTGRRLSGGRWIRPRVPLERVPLYVRAGKAIPLGPERPYVGDGPVEIETLALYSRSAARRRPLRHAPPLQGTRADSTSRAARTSTWS